MTALAAWAGVDQRGLASIYITSDSRISWGSKSTWDMGRKLFASSRFPEVFGYCGDVLFPSLVLGQAITLVDSGLLFWASDSPGEKIRKLTSLLDDSFASYPNAEKRDFSIIFCTRIGEGMDSSFHMATLKWSRNSWDIDTSQMPHHSTLLVSLGSGANSVKSWHGKWEKAQGERTSRAVFSAFCDSLQSGEDQFVGGAPQLVGVYRRGPAMNFGVIYSGRRFIAGLPVDSIDFSSVEWRNELFERCDGKSLTVLHKAQKHAKPKGL